MTTCAGNCLLLLMVSMMVSFCAVLFFPRDVLDGTFDLIESVSEGFPTYSCKVSEASLMTVLATQVELEKPQSHR